MKACCLIGLLLLAPALFAQQNPKQLLDVSIRVFDTAEPAARTPETAPPTPPATEQEQTAAASFTPEEVSQAEQRYIPMLLRYKLEADGGFGAVRVLPLLDNGAELRIEGSILHSDASRLELAITARDSSDRIWIDKVYSGEAVNSEALNGDPLLDDDFDAVYRQIVQDLRQQQALLEPGDIERIDTLALLRYGRELAPESFEDYLGQQEDGTLTIRRLPAREDPILQRVEAIREREYLFIDVVDEEYSRFYTDIKPVYDMWREYSREQRRSAADYTRRNLNEPSDFRRGTYYALQESYNNYRWAKLQDIYLDELSQGFANETEPTEIELSDSLYRLTGTMEQQYREWRGILSELFRLETGAVDAGR